MDPRTDHASSRRFDQLHLAIAGAMKDHHLPFRIAENKHIAIAEVGFLDCFFERHGAQGYGLIAADHHLVQLTPYSK